MSMKYEEKTGSVVVRVEPQYLDEQSYPDQNIYVWAYHVEIENQGGEPIQLVNRFWKITDAMGRTQEVRGAGVVGEQPVIKPGSRYSYTSGTPLSTPSGIMLGSYEMSASPDKTFTVNIPAFSLDSPHESGKAN